MSWWAHVRADLEKAIHASMLKLTTVRLASATTAGKQNGEALLEQLQLQVLLQVQSWFLTLSV
jgi:hypothetical protein